MQTGNYSPLKFAIGTQNAALRQKVAICRQNTTRAAVRGRALSCRLLTTALAPFFARMTGIHISDIEAAINHWRQRLPSSAGMALAPQVQALAEVYALMVYRHEDTVEEGDLPLEALDAWLGWYDTTPDTPCIAICSTSQGDDLCKGCGRTFDEVQHWPAMGPAAKRQVWRRITLEHTAWRFTRYAERAAEGASKPPAV